MAGAYAWGDLRCPDLSALGSAAVIVVAAALTLNVVVNPQRAGGPPSSDSPSSSQSPIPGGMWPQSNIEEVRVAQELADAGDPEYAWQVDPQLSSEEGWSHLIGPGGPEIVERFLREELGWESFLFNVFVGSDGDGPVGGHTDLTYLRCAPGEANLLYSSVPDQPQGAGSCAPTIDDLRYETVRLDLAQLDRQGATGIWVVRRWAMDDPFAQIDPNLAEANVTARLEKFLAARIAGEGAEGYVDVDAGGMRVFGLDEVPLLYGTSTGAPYERYEIDVVGGPRWPYSDLDFDVRLFADSDETVVEQCSPGAPRASSMTSRRRRRTASR